MGEPVLTPEEGRLKDLLASLNLVPAEEIEKVAGEVLLVRRYGGNVDLKRRLIDAGLLRDRQLDAVERGLHPKAEAAIPEAQKPETRSYIDISRLTGSPASKEESARLGNLRLASQPVPQGAAATAQPAAETGQPKGSLKGGFSPSWAKKQAGEEGEQLLEAAEMEAEITQAADTVEEREKRLRHIIRHIVHTRQHEQVLDCLIRRKTGVVEPAEVAKTLNIREREVRRVLDDLKASGVIRDIGTHPYALSPSRRDLEDLKFFFWIWRDPKWHGKVLSWLLEEEKKRGG